MTNLKLFTAHSAIVPFTWCVILQLPDHIRQADVVVVAPSKVASHRMFEACGAPGLLGWGLQSPPWRHSPKAVAALRAAGVISETEPGIWVMPELPKQGSLVAAVRPDRETAVVARFVRDGTDLAALPVSTLL